MRDFQHPGRSPVIATNGLCATSHPLAAKVAVQMLEAGGNAVDAALAAGVLLGFCEPQMAGLGGDCFALIQPPGDGPIVAMNGSGRAPAGLDAEALRAAGQTAIPLTGASPVTVPGAVAAFCRLADDWGRLGLKTVLAPAIHYAEAGIPVAPRVAYDWHNTHATLGEEARRHYLRADAPLKAGALFRAPAQAEVLRRVADEGPAGFYQGEVAEDMVAALKAAGGSHSLADFAAADCEYATPVSGSYRDCELVEHPPNGQGATAILIAHMLQDMDIAALDPLGAARIHLEAEATKLAYDARDRFVADGEDGGAGLARMLDRDTARSLALLIDPNRAMTDPRARAEAVHRDTVYLTVVDRDRMAVSLIYSIFHPFGSGLASPKFGILFHNRGAGFTLEPGHPNEAAGGKRPMHTIIPGMLKRGGRLIMPFGVMGGAYQPTGHMRLLSNLLDFGMDLQSAIDAPRAFSEKGLLKIERGYPHSVLQDLAGLGHKVTSAPTPIGGAQAIWIDEAAGTLVGGSDPRKDGCALGY